MNLSFIYANLSFAGGRYKVIKEIGQGSFGRVFKALDTVTGEQVAAKFEAVEPKHEWDLNGGVEREFKVYQILKGKIGVPNIHFFGQAEDEQHNILVMDLLGPSLSSLLRDNGQFSMKTLLMLMIQMLERLEQLHLMGWVHQDISLENFVMGTGQLADTVFLIDYGFARDLQSGAIKTDMKNLGSTLQDAFRGDPIKFVVKDVTKMTQKEKERRTYPKEFQEYFSYCELLHAKQKPDYQYLKGIFKQMLEKMGYENDKNFDWTTKNNLEESANRK